ncbi:hypothetical protein KSD_55270 [Ktedonobacter sp. SOSP1-85]|uniref:YybH family protein n=1 Tax=Ktedonobacter sp. SOSP1-85 TaxID=2778367 RepID=UPI001A204890|nr:nuclear transport factor 2 family protein [Ktedonobacter sp. SOSP1-85]GHO77756.1 hypothetical protein KSD_55270 [Ktedonobacter sp. SOSP1-85]
MSNLESIVDRFEIEALRGEFTDAAMMHDYNRLASLFTQDGAVRVPHINAQAVGQEQIRAGTEVQQGLWDYFVQTTHPGTIQLLGDTAVGRAYISELGRLRDGRCELNYAIYHDRYQRTEDGWKFAERVYEVRYLDHTPLAGSAPQAAEETMAVEDNKKNDEAAIKRVIEGGVEAIRAKDLDGVMSMYAPELVSFDIVPPLQYVGTDAYRKQWEKVFSSFPGPINYEIADLSITAGDNVAFAHSFNRLSAALPTGQKIGNWLRWTACFRKIGGKWLLAHMQASVPVDLETGRAVLDLKP